MGLSSASRWTLVAIVVTLAVSGCSKDVTGPEPTVEPPSASAEPPPVDPEIVCRDQLVTEVIVTGEDFSPVPIDVPDAPKAALPTITLTRSHELAGGEVGDPDQIIYSGDYDKDPTNATDEDGELILVDGEPLLKWKSQTEMSFLVTQDLVIGAAPEGGAADDRDTGMLPVGVYDVTVDNANGSTTESLQTLAVVDKPMVDDLTPDSPGVVCLSQGDRTLNLTGSTFLRNEGAIVELDVEGVDSPFSVSISSCTDIEHAGLDAEFCGAGEIPLARDSIDVGYWALTMRNPETAECESTEDIKLRVVPPPTIDRVVPPLGCVTEEDRVFVIEGTDFLRVDGNEPNITVGGMDFAPDDMGGCEALETQGNTVEMCTSLTFTVAMGQLAPDLYDVTVTNPDPAGCDNTATGSLRIVPPPSIDDIQPPLICVDDSARDVVVSGSDFLIVDGEIPAVEVDGGVLDPSAVSVMGCEDLEVDGLTVEKCDTLTVTIAQNGVGVGMPAVKVTNPDPAGCSDERGDLLTVVEGPVIESAAPALLCTIDGSKAIEITGTGFLSIDDVLPGVMVDGAAVASVDSVANCSDVTVNGLDVQQCTTLNVTVAQGALTDDSRPEVVVMNPDPAGCMATNGEVLTVPPVLEISAVTPINVCQNDTNPAFAFSVSGTGFMRVDGADFAFRVGGTDVTPDMITDCADLTVAGVSNVQACSTIDATIDLTGLTDNVGMIPVEVQNANVAACDLTAMAALNVVPPPSLDLNCGPGNDEPCIDIVDNDTDSDVCSDIAFSVILTGMNFVEGTTVRFEQDSSDAGTVVVEASAVTINSDTELQADFTDGLEFDPADPTWDLIIESAGNCASPPVIDAVTVNPSPLVFFVDPPVAYNAISIDATVFAANLSAASALERIDLIDSSDVEVTLCDTDGGNAIADCGVNPARRNKIVATIPDENPDDPGNPFAPGTYDVRVTSSLDCEGTLEGGLTITDTVTLTGLAISPSFASTSSPTAVTITADPSPGFQAIPRVYLSPAGGGTAEALRAVVVEDSGQLTAVIPAGLNPDEYSLIVVNPDGSVGVLDANLVDAVFVTDDPPTITSVSPAFMPANEAANAVTITGTNFDTVTGVDVAYDCLAPDGTPLTLPVSGISADSDTSISLTVNSSGQIDGTICTVTVTNLDDTAFFTFSAVAIRNNDNLNAWSAQTGMLEGRRALALVASRPTATSRFLHAIGGDDGTVAGAKTSVESVSVDIFGNLGAAWFLQDNSLPAARTESGFTRIDNFIYLTGGHDGSSAVDSVLRAEVLDPLAGPEIDDVNAVLGDPDAAPATGLPGALWQYQVAYLYPADDPNNPGGESIAGEILNVQLPDRAEGIVLSLGWDEAQNVNGDPVEYRLYRTTSDADATIQLLATCPGDTGCNCTGTGAGTCVYTDDGNTAVTASTAPLPPGSLGVWHQPFVDNNSAGSAATMMSAREGHVTVAVKHPNATDHADDWVLYSFGGRDDNPTVLNDYEFSIVTVAGGTQSMGAWTVGDRTIGVAKADAAGWAVTNEDTPFVPAGEVYIFLGTGYTDTGGSTTAELRSGSLKSDTMGGHLVTIDGTSLDTENAPQARAATCFGGAGRFINMFGGESGPALADLTAQDRAGTITDNFANPPNTESSWNAPGGGSLAIRRAYCATTQESAFYFTAGGRTDEGATGTPASNSVERTVE